MKATVQRGFATGALLVGIALIGVVVGVAALVLRSNSRDLNADKQKASATVVAKRVADLVEKHQIQIAEAGIKPGQGFLASVSNDMNSWPKDIFIDKADARAINEGTVTYITNVTPEFCASLNQVLQVEGIPTPDTAPSDRIACVVAPEPTN